MQQPRYSPAPTIPQAATGIRNNTPRAPSIPNVSS